jgi:hypothetical protein
MEVATPIVAVIQYMPPKLFTTGMHFKHTQRHPSKYSLIIHPHKAQEHEALITL